MSALSLLVTAALAMPAAGDTLPFVVMNHGRVAGEMLVIHNADAIVVRYHHADRNRSVRSETIYHLNPASEVIGAETWELPFAGAPEGLPADDGFEIARDSVFWGVAGTRGGARLQANAYYDLRSSTLFDQARLAQFLLGQPEQRARLLPSGTARAEIVADTALPTPRGIRRLRLVAIHRELWGNPDAVWLDEAGGPFASAVSWFITVRRGGEELLPALRAIEARWRDARGAAFAQLVAPPPAPALAIVNGDLFDSERGKVLRRTTVIVRGDRIAAVGPGGTIAIPEGATVIDAAGKTVMPGMWDMHTHLQLTSQTGTAAYQLASGVTTMRDLGSDVDIAVSYRDRAAAGGLAGPRAILSGLPEGPGAWAGRSEAIVRTEDEARRWVARYDSLGYRQVKVYNLVHPDLVPAIADEAHRRGMRLSGHIPRGLTVPAAIALGFDEINHAAFLFSTFYQDSLYLPAMRSYASVAVSVAPNMDVNGRAMSALIDLLRTRRTVIDGTFQLWLWGRAVETSRIPFAQRSDRNYLRLLARLHKAGVPIVPGTDGMSFVGELEVYEEAGIRAADVLRMATIVPARVMGEDRDYGSIAVGKVADIVIVGGRPHERIADLRKVEQVVRAGRIYDSAALRAAVMQ